MPLEIEFDEDINEESTDRNQEMVNGSACSFVAGYKEKYGFPPPAEAVFFDLVHQFARGYSNGPTQENIEEALRKLGYGKSITRDYRNTTQISPNGYPEGQSPTRDQLKNAMTTLVKSYADRLGRGFDKKEELRENEKHMIGPIIRLQEELRKLFVVTEHMRKEEKIDWYQILQEVLEPIELDPIVKEQVQGIYRR